MYIFVNVKLVKSEYSKQLYHYQITISQNTNRQSCVLIAGGHEYRVLCKVVARCPHHYLGKENEARNTEHFMEYVINEGIHANGVAEWNYRNVGGKQDKG